MIDRNLNYGRHLIKKFTVNIPNHSTVLDIGAGLGTDLLLVKSNNPTVVLNGVEFYPPYQEILKSKNIKVCSLNVEKDKLPFNDESVDLIICNQVFEHLKEIWWVMSEISRVLKVNGQLIVGVPNLAALHNRILLLFGKQPACIKNDSAHLRGYTKEDLTNFVSVISGNSFKLNSFKGSNFYPFSPCIAKPLAMCFPTLAVTNFYSFNKIKKSGSNYLDFPKTEKLETNFYLGKDIPHLAI